MAERLKEKIIESDNMVNVVSKLQSGQMEVHSTGENGEPEHYKVGLECNRKEAGANIDGEVIEIQRDEGFDLHKSGAETMPHTSRKEAEHDDKQLIAKLCKICSTGKKKKGR
jgi:hypothetical protein